MVNISATVLGTEIAQVELLDSEIDALPNLNLEPVSDAARDSEILSDQDAIRAVIKAVCDFTKTAAFVDVLQALNSTAITLPDGQTVTANSPLDELAKTIDLAVDNANLTTQFDDATHPNNTSGIDFRKVLEAVDPAEMMMMEVMGSALFIDDGVPGVLAALNDAFPGQINLDSDDVEAVQELLRAADAQDMNSTETRDHLIDNLTNRSSTANRPEAIVAALIGPSISNSNSPPFFFQNGLQSNMCFGPSTLHLGCWGQNMSRIQNKEVYATLYLQVWRARTPPCRPCTP